MGLEYCPFCYLVFMIVVSLIIKIADRQRPTGEDRLDGFYYYFIHLQLMGLNFDLQLFFLRLPPFFDETWLVCWLLVGWERVWRIG